MPFSFTYETTGKSKHEVLEAVSVTHGGISEIK
jgi:hypothetical protein